MISLTRPSEHAQQVGAAILRFWGEPTLRACQSLGVNSLTSSLAPCSEGGFCTMQPGRASASCTGCSSQHGRTLTKSLSIRQPHPLWRHCLQP